MIGDVVRKGDIEEGVNELIDPPIALSLQVKTFEDVMPPGN
jgi:hypothetical protein